MVLFCFLLKRKGEPFPEHLFISLKEIERSRPCPDTWHSQPGHLCVILLMDVKRKCHHAAHRALNVLSSDSVC